MSYSKLYYKTVPYTLPYLNPPKGKDHRCITFEAKRTNFGAKPDRLYFSTFWLDEPALRNHFLRWKPKSLFVFDPDSFSLLGEPK